MPGELSPDHPMVAIPFSVANAVTNATNVDLAGAGGNTLVAMPKAGSVVGIAVSASADLTAGSATVKAHKASTEFTEASAIALTLNDTNQRSYSFIRRGAVKFAAGDTIGVSYSSTTDMAPTNTNDLDALLFVMFDND